MNATHPDMVERQLIRIEQSPHFSHSRRYPAFLKHVVRKTMDGQQNDLKERIIGMEAFGRAPGYDLSADPIVRVTAGEVRKRLAQYYYEPDHQGELRIELRPGSYIPEFKPALGQSGIPSTPAPADITPKDAAAEASGSVRSLLFGGVLLVTAVLLACFSLRASVVEQFWHPLLKSPGPVLISVGSVTAMINQPASAMEAASVGGHPLHSDPVALADTIAVAMLQQVLSTRGAGVHVQSSTQTSFSDLQKGPVILVSGFDNPWTMRLTGPLRFHFVRPSANTFEIEDRADPRRKWSVYTLAPFDKFGEDYGLIARFHDPTTGQLVLVAAGIGENGTVAAAEMLSDEHCLVGMQQARLLPRGAANFEAVIGTEIIDGKPGPPRALATYVW